MTDRKKVIKELKDIRNSIATGQINGTYAMGVTICYAIDLLKEDCHNCKLECLLQKYDELKEKYDALLKEKEETELCDRCGRRRLKSNREGQ